MENNNKALAVELTKTFVTVVSQIKKPTGEQVYTLNADDVITVLKKFHNAVKELD